MQVLVFNIEHGAYSKEYWPDAPHAEVEDLGKPMDVDGLKHTSLPPSLMSRHAFRGSGRQGLEAAVVVKAAQRAVR